MIIAPSARVPGERPAGPLLVGLVLLLAVMVPATAVLQVPLAIVGVVCGVGALLILSLRPEIATLVVIAIVYSNAAAVAVQIHDVPFALAAGSTMLLAIPLAHHVLIRREELVLPRALPWILGFLGVQLISTLLAVNSTSAAEFVGSFVAEGLLLYFLIVNAVRSERTLLSVVWILIVCGAALSAVALHQQLTQDHSNLYLGFAQVGGDLIERGDDFRPGGPFEEANRFAQVLVMLLPLVLAMIWGGLTRWLRLLLLACGGLIAVGIALTLSRGAAVGFLLVLVLMVLLRFVRLRHLAIVAIALAALFVAVPEYGTRLESLQRVPGVAQEGVEADGSVRSRLTEMAAAALVFVDHPVLGVGPGQFPTYYIEYAEDFGLRVKSRDREAHNLYVGVAADYGAVGFVLFFGAIGVTLRELWRARRAIVDRHRVLASLCAGFFFSIVAYLTTGLFLHLAYERYLWLFLALGAVTAALARARAEPTDAGPRTSAP